MFLGHVVLGPAENKLVCVLTKLKLQLACQPLWPHPLLIACARIAIQALFRVFNFHGLPINHENCKNWILRKFPAIRYETITKWHPWTELKLKLQLKWSSKKQLKLTLKLKFNNKSHFIIHKYQLVHTLHGISGWYYHYRTRVREQQLIKKHRCQKNPVVTDELLKSESYAALQI